MPDYGYRCTCGERFRRQVSVPDRDEPLCPACHKKAKRLFEPPRVRVVTPFRYPYWDVGLGRYIRNPSEHKDVMKEMEVEHKR